MSLQEHGAYEIIERIAVGGMAEIYLGHATDGGFRRPVVIKKIHPRFSEDDDFVRMLINEAKITARLNHVNIVQILDLVCGTDGEHFIVMEYVQGKDLRGMMDRSKAAGVEIPLDLILYMAEEICAGLDYAHRLSDEQGSPLGLIHRDISPSNVLISTGGEVKLTDFGVARFGRNVSQVGSLKGKLGYMAPEQARGEVMDHRGDIFSVGALLFELLVGRKVFQADTDIGMLWEVRRAEIPMPSLIKPTIHTRIERIILRTLAPSPDDRFGSVQELGDALRSFRFDTCDATANSADLSTFLQTLFDEQELAVPTGEAAAPRMTLTAVIALDELPHADAPPNPTATVETRPPHLPPEMEPELDEATELARALTAFPMQWPPEARKPPAIERRPSAALGRPPIAALEPPPIAALEPPHKEEALTLDRAVERVTRSRELADDAPTLVGNEHEEAIPEVPYEEDVATEVDPQSDHLSFQSPPATGPSARPDPAAVKPAPVATSDAAGADDAEEEITGKFPAQDFPLASDQEGPHSGRPVAEDQPHASVLDEDYDEGPTNIVTKGRYREPPPQEAWLPMDPGSQRDHLAPPQPDGRPGAEPYVETPTGNVANPPPKGRSSLFGVLLGLLVTLLLAASGLILYVYLGTHQG